MTALQSSFVPMFSRRSMAAATHEGKIYFFGGVGAAGTESILDVSADLWCFDTATLTWRQIPQVGAWPSPRRCVGWISCGEKLLLWGGSGIFERLDGTFGYNFLNDEWEFDIATESWRLLRATDDYRLSPTGDDAPFPRYTPVLQKVGNELFLFGGYTEDRQGKRKLNDAWIRAGLHWKQISAGVKQGYGPGDNWPGLRYGCMSAADETTVFVCGGFSDDGDHNDLWAFDVAECQWRLLVFDQDLGSVPQARYCAAFACYQNRLFMFGGRSRRFPKLNFNDLWVYDLTASRWTQLSGNHEPHRYDAVADCPGYHAKASSAVAAGSWYIWGGEGVSGHVSDFWRFDFSRLTWQMIQAARPDDPKFW